jgi:hypothetical protein
MDDESALRGRRGHSFPLIVFGAIVLAATGFYWQTFPSCRGAPQSCLVTTRSDPVNFATSGLAPLLPFHNHWVGVYWLAAIPSGFLLSIWYLRRGKNMARLAMAASASAVLLLLIVLRSSLVGWPLLVLPRDLTVRGLAALLVIGAGLVVWAFAERSPRLTIVVGLFVAAALVSCLYDISDVARFGSSPNAAELPNIVLPGLFLLLGGAAVGLSERRVPTSEEDAARAR